MSEQPYSLGRGFLHWYVPMANVPRLPRPCEVALKPCGQLLSPREHCGWALGRRHLPILRRQSHRCPSHGSPTKANPTTILMLALHGDSVTSVSRKGTKRRSKLNLDYLGPESRSRNRKVSAPRWAFPATQQHLFLTSILSDVLRAFTDSKSRELGWCEGVVIPCFLRGKGVKP